MYALRHAAQASILDRHLSLLQLLVYRADSRNEAALMMEGDEDIGQFKRVALLLSAYGWCVAGELSRQLLANVLSIYSPSLLKEYPGHIPRVPHA